MEKKQKQTRKQKLVRFIRRIPLWLRHGPFLAYWMFYDSLLAIWVYLRGIDYVGVYVRTMSPSEWVLLFEDDIGCGYAGYSLIKIGFDKSQLSVDRIINLLNHEVLHQVLGRRISNKASHKLDDVHELRKTSAIICEDGKIKILSMIRFPV